MTNRKIKTFSLVSTPVLAFSLLFSFDLEKSFAASGAEKILDYNMSAIEGNVIKDSAGNFDGKLIVPANVERKDVPGVVSLGGEGTHIEIPKGVLDGKENLTVSSLVNWSGKKSAEWLFSFGRDSSRYLYFTPKYNADSSTRFGIATNGWRNEVSSKSATFPANQWKLVTTVIDGGEKSLKTYIDGKLIATGSTNGISLADINNVTGPSGFIGKSMYSGDPYFGGVVADFEVYAGALSEVQVSELALEAQQEIASMEKLLLEDASNQLDYAAFLKENSSKDEIKTDLALPGKGANGTVLTWKSSNQSVISDAGKVIRPSYEEGNQQVVLTATISDGKNAVTKEFTVTVVSEPKDSEAAKSAAAALKVHNIHDVRGNITLPEKGEYNTTITWASGNPSVISNTGEVKRPAHGEGDIEVKLVATITKKDQTVTKSFLAKVKELPEKPDYKGYAFSYFAGEGYADGEQIYFGLSEGNDPLHWQELNGGKPVFSSELGEQGLRDPFILRSPEGDKFYMIATDLKMHGSGDWNKAQTDGSKSIMIWESTDLVNWSEQRMEEIAPAEAGNTWAPEFFYDEKIGEYVVFWASKLYETEEDRSSGNSYQKMMYATTRDFHTFSEPKVYMDYGYSIIDTTMIEHDGKVYRFTKDERSNNSSSPNGKFIFQEVGDSVLDPDFKMITEGIGKGDIRQGEGPAVFKSNTEEKWYLFIDEFGGRGYVPFETTDLNSGKWTVSKDYDLPSRPRHGTVLPVTQTEYDALLKNVPVEVEKPEPANAVTGISVDQEEIELAKGKQTKLIAAIAPQNAANKNVLWSSNNEGVAVVADDGTVTAVKEGSAVVTAASEEGGFIATVNITVTEPADEEAPSIPAELSAQASVDAVDLSWTASTDNEAVAGYKVYRNGEEVGTTDALTYRDAGLTDATVYKYSVKAFDAAGNVSEASETVNVTTSTSTDLLKGRLDGLVKSGDVGGPLVKKLENALDQAIQQKAKGHEAQAAKHLEDFLKHLDKAKADQVTAEAKSLLKSRADRLIGMWAGR